MRIVKIVCSFSVSLYLSSIISLADKETLQAIHSLNPRSIVYETTIIELCGGLRFFSLPIQKAWLDWIVLVLDFVNRIDNLRMLYDVFFSLLDYESLRFVLSSRQ